MNKVIAVFVVLMLVVAPLQAIPCPSTIWYPGEPEPEPNCPPVECDVQYDSQHAIFADYSELVRFRGVDECTGEVVACERSYSCPAPEYATEASSTCQARNAYLANTVLPCP